MDTVHRPQAHKEEKKVYIQTPENTYEATKIVSAPVDDKVEPYTVQEIESGNVHKMMAADLHDSDPDQIVTDPLPTATSTPFPLLPWLKPQAKTTLYLNKIMAKPKQGILHHGAATDVWSFSPGKKYSHPHINLPNFSVLTQSMVTNHKLFQGWKISKTVLSARCLRSTSNVFAHHVSAASLNVLNAPSLLRHSKLDPNGKALWDVAYRE